MARVSWLTKPEVIRVLEKPGEEDLTIKIMTERNMIRAGEMMTAEKKLMIKIKGFIALDVFSWDI